MSSADHSKMSSADHSKMSSADKAVGLLHPGAMGASVGAALVAGGARVLWAADGRSPETKRRAEEAGLVPVDDLATLVREATEVS